MCGIHGIINKSPTSKYGFDGFMKDGFHVGSLRGMDSSGVFQIDKAGKPFMFKLAVPGPVFIESKFTGQFMRDACNCPLTVGHVRAATVGRPTIDNAHPFCINREDGTRLLGVHNGTLQGWNYKVDGSKFDVDSEWALHRIANEGADAFEVFQGAWALVWWDERTKDKVWVARNTERPLFFVRTKDKSSILFASEAGMLSWLAERNRIDVEDKLYTFEPGKLYCIDMSGAEITWSKSSYPAYKTVQYTPQNNNRSHWNPANARWEDRRGRADVTGIYGVDDDYDPNTRCGVDPGCSLDVEPADKGKKQTSEHLSDDAKEVIDGMKKALAANRDARFQKQKSETTGEGTKISEEVKEDYQATEYQCKPDWYSTNTATVAEQQNARDAQIMGELQFFQGIEFDPDCAELLGEIEDFVPGSGKIKYDALMRGCTSTMARKYCLTDIDTRQRAGVWVAIIGKGVDTKWKGTYYVVTPLNEKGQAAMPKNKIA